MLWAFLWSLEIWLCGWWGNWASWNSVQLTVDKLSCPLHVSWDANRRINPSQPLGGVRGVVPWRPTKHSLTALLHSSCAKYNYGSGLSLWETSGSLSWMKIYWSPACVFSTAFQHCASVHAFSVQMVWRKEGTPRSAFPFFLLVLTCIRYIQWHSNRIFSFDGKQFLY